MTHFETLLVESMRDLAKQVQENNSLCVRLDERSEGFERRLEALERAASAGPVSVRRRRIEPREAVVGGTALVSLVVAIAQAIAAPPAAPAAPTPRPPVAAGAP